MTDRRKLRLPGRQLLPQRNLVRWPDGARLAVAITVDCYSSDAVSVHHMLASSLDFGPERGAVDLATLFGTLGVAATFNVAGATAEARPALARELRAAGHDIGVLGHRFEPHWNMSRDDEAAAVARARDAVAASIGSQPVGWRTPQSRPTVETLPLLLEAGFVWDSSLRNDDVPYAIELLEGSLIEIPAGGPGDDSGYVGFPAPITPPADVLAVWRDEFDMLYSETATQAGLMTLTLSPSYMGRRVGLSVLRELVAHMRQHEGIWFATCGEIAAIWRENAHWQRERAA